MYVYIHTFLFGHSFQIDPGQVQTRFCEATWWWGPQGGWGNTTSSPHHHRGWRHQCIKDRLFIGIHNNQESNIGFTRFHTYPGYVLASKFCTRTLGSRMIAECRCGFRFSTDRTGWKPCKWPKTSNVPHVRQMFLSRMYFVFGRGIENRWIS